MFVGLSVCLSVTVVSPVKQAEPIEMPVWVVDLCEPNKQFIRFVPYLLMRSCKFEGRMGRLIVKYRDTVL